MPLVSALVAVHDDAPHIRYAVDSVLRQTIEDLELIVVDDASSDETPSILRGISDPRVRVVTSERQSGLAASLNRGLELVQGRFVARLDSDDVAFPDWLEHLVARIRRQPPAAVVGTGIAELDAAGRPGPVHRLPQGANAVRWHALFSSPFFHSTVLLEREVLDAHGLRYDPAFLESEDYELWTRLLALADGDNLAEPLVLRRMHPGQAQARRGGLQRSFQREVAMREIARLAPDLAAGDAELAWRLGTSQPLLASDRARAGDAYVALLECFERTHGVDASVRSAAARALGRAGLVRLGMRLRPAAPIEVARDRTARRGRMRQTHRSAQAWLAELEPEPRQLRVTVVSPEPTPYRSPLFDLIAARQDIDLTVIYAARSVASRTWSVVPAHSHVFLHGVRIPGARRLVRHDYPVTPGLVSTLARSRPEVVVVSGWSTFASQAAIAWSRARRVPYVLHVESHDLGPRAPWRRRVKDAVATRVIQAAASVLVVGSAARDSVVARGASRVRVFANTIDVTRWIERAERLERAAHDGLVVLSVGRPVPEKGFDLLADACSAAGVRLELVTGGVAEDELAQGYVDADVFALLSRHEPWGVVVNEAAASGLPLVLSDQVGAAYDLLRDGENGFLVPSGDVAAAAAALRRLAGDQALRARMGVRSRELVGDWSYEPSVDNFVAAVREATSR